MKYLFLTIVLALSMTACLNLDEEESPAQFFAYGIITDNNSGFKITTDTLSVLYSPTVPTNFEPEIGKRVMVVFSIAAEGSEALGYNSKINISEIKSILLRDIINVDQAARDTLKLDPFISSTFWVGNHYINFEVKYGGTSDVRHDFYLGYDPDQQNVPGKTVLTFYHDKNNDTETYPYWTIRSFDLNSISWTGTKPYPVIIRNKTASTTQDVEFNYNPLTTPE